MMTKKIIFFIVFLIAGFNLVYLARPQNSITNDNFKNQNYPINQQLQFQNCGSPHQIFREPHQAMLRRNPFYAHQQFIDYYFQNKLNFIPTNQYRQFNPASKLQKPKFTFSPCGVKQDWAHIYESNLLPGYDIAVDVAIDQQDNIYVTGYTTNSPQGMDFCTIKYDNNGSQIWGVYYNGVANGDDIASAISIDDSGNVYVAGTASMNGTKNDFVIVKYDSQGQKLWEYHYDSPSHGNDELVAMVTDHSGSLYATGSSVTESGLQLSTIKINTAGVFQWVTTYRGPGKRDWGKAITVDSKGNVYVAGVSKGLNYDNDYVTIKYNSDGSQLWAKRYYRAELAQENLEAIVVDDLENVYVTGGGYGDNGSDYVTIKYDKNGEVLWMVRYDGAGDQNDYDQAYDLTLDKKGNVYVTGSNRIGSFGYDDNFATIKYNPDGVQQWLAEYGAGDGTSDIAYKVLVDDSDYVYVCGSSEFCEECRPDFLTIKYTPQGERMWLVRYDGTGNSNDYPYAMAVNHEGEVVVTGYSEGKETGLDYATVKYDTKGNQQWKSRFNGKNRERGFVNDLKIDDWGNIYVTGGSCNEFITIKYNSLGEVEWTARLTGEQHGYGEANCMAVDQQGNVYLIGENILDVAEYNYDFITVKYNADGMQQWTARYDSPPDQWGRYEQDFPVDIDVDKYGNSYVTGYGPGKGSGCDIITIKYGSDGVQQWMNRYTSEQDNSNEPIDIAIDKQGGVYVCGNSYGADPDFVMVKYNSSGEQQWTEVYDGVDARIYSATLDGWGNVYVVGCDGEFWENNELIIFKYSHNGERQWTARYKYQDYLVRGGNIRVDELGNIFITATLFQWDPFIFWNFVALKYNSNGTKLWESPLKSEYSHMIDESIALDSENNLYVACNLGNDFAILKYDNQGAEKWTLIYDNPRNIWQLSKAMEIDKNGNLYVASDSRGKNWCVFNTIKFVQTGDDSIIAPVITGYDLANNFPNPFRQQTLIYYQIPGDSRITIKIFNQLGQQVAYEDLGEKPAGKFAYHFNASNLPSGIYFYQLKADNFLKTRKMILAR